MNNFSISSFGDNGSIKKDSDKNSFKESLTGIEKYWNDLNVELDKKKKDLEELNRMEKLYEMEEFQYIKDRVKMRINSINMELINIQKIMWDVRTKILFFNSNGESN